MDSRVPAFGAGAAAVAAIAAAACAVVSGCAAVKNGSDAGGAAAPEPEPEPELRPALTVAVDTKRVSGVPCILAPPKLAKQALALLRASGWHPAHHSRLVLDRRHPATSLRAYQVSDDAAAILALLLARDGAQGEATTSGAADPSSSDTDGAAVNPEAGKLLALLRAGELSWRPVFQLHEYIIDEDRGGADQPTAPESTAGGLGDTAAATQRIIRYLPAREYARNQLPGWGSSNPDSGRAMRLHSIK